MTAALERLQLPPVTPCPPWCDEGFHSWEPDAEGFTREHSQLTLVNGTAVEIYNVDWWVPGAEAVERAVPIVAINGETYEASQAQALAEAAQLLRDVS